MNRVISKKYCMRMASLFQAYNMRGFCTEMGVVVYDIEKHKVYVKGSIITTLY